MEYYRFKVEEGRPLYIDITVQSETGYRGYSHYQVKVENLDKNYAQMSAGLLGSKDLKLQTGTKAKLCDTKNEYGYKIKHQFVPKYLFGVTDGDASTHLIDSWLLRVNGDTGLCISLVLIQSLRGNYVLLDETNFYTYCQSLRSVAAITHEEEWYPKGLLTSYYHVAEKRTSVLFEGLAELEAEYKETKDTSLLFDEDTSQTEWYLQFMSRAFSSIHAIIGSKCGVIFGGSNSKEHIDLPDEAQFELASLNINTILRNMILDLRAWNHIETLRTDMRGGYLVIGFEDTLEKLQAEGMKTSEAFLYLCRHLNWYRGETTGAFGTMNEVVMKMGQFKQLTDDKKAEHLLLNTITKDLSYTTRFSHASMIENRGLTVQPLFEINDFMENIAIFTNWLDNLEVSNRDFENLKFHLVGSINDYISFCIDLADIEENYSNLLIGRIHVMRIAFLFNVKRNVLKDSYQIDFRGSRAEYHQCIVDTSTGQRNMRIARKAEKLTAFENIINPFILKQEIQKAWDQMEEGWKRGLLQV